MQNYEAGKPSYFATPPPQLVRALNTALHEIMSEPLQSRFAKHVAASDKVKKAIADLGLEQVADDPALQTHAMTAAYWPAGFVAADVLPKLAAEGILIAGGVHREIAPCYFRIGHMGVSAVDPERKDLDNAIEKLKKVFAEAGYKPPKK